MGRMMEIYGIIEDHEVREIMEDMELASVEEAAALWLSETCHEGEWTREEMPAYSELDGEAGGYRMYHDYGAGYYFLAREIKEDAEDAEGP